MPSYYYHIALELLSCPEAYPRRGESPLTLGLHQDSHPETTSLSFVSACEALLPFQERQIIDRKSSGRSARQSNHQNSGEKIARLDGSHHHTTTTPTPTTATTGSSSKSHTAASNHYHYHTRTGTSQPHLFTKSPTNAPDLEKDPRLDEVVIECIDMVSPQHETTASKRTLNANTKKNNSDNNNSHHNPVAIGIGTDILGGLRTKGRYIPLDQKTSESVWGIVHLYRDEQETPYLGSNSDDYPTALTGSAAARQPSGRLGGSNSKNNSDTQHAENSCLPSSSSSSSLQQHQNKPDEDCTTLCILAVPSYLSPSDFLGFVCEKTRNDVSHFRMIKTARANRYMVLMKFRSGKKAAEWQKEWNGKVFNSMEPETCHVVFVKTVEIQAVGPEAHPGITPSQQLMLGGAHSSPSPQRATITSAPSATLSTKPLAPRTPALIELPTCPVCLERMDETTGLLTIICQHVFHCTCLQKWKGSGCPVCRYTQDDFRKNSSTNNNTLTSTRPFFGNGGDEDLTTECTVCHSELNLWVCLICGNIGCGRYDLAHAFAHYKETSHAFAMDLSTQRVWDYVGDSYVHRIIQSKTDGKLVELPAADNSALDPPDWTDAVPREKLENISVEYTHLLTSQLESQRAYFEEIVERAADKASQASAAASSAQTTAETVSEALSSLQNRYDKQAQETIPNLERDKARTEKRAEKFESMARKMEKEWREEKAMNESLMQRVEFLSGSVEKLEVSNRDLEEQNRDLTFFISGSERLKGVSEDVVQGTISVPESGDGSGRRKGKGKKKVNN